MIVGVAFCPHPPALIPELGVGLSAELDPVRAASVAAVRAVCADSVRHIVLLGAGLSSGRLDGARSNLNRFGVNRELHFGHADDAAVELPVSLLVGAWLIQQAGLSLPVTAFGVVAGLDGDESIHTSQDVRQLATTDDVALIVLGDGSARRTEKAPGYIDERAAAFDDGVLAALASGDPAALIGLDAELGAELLAAGVPAWRVAGATLDSARFDAELTYQADPFGVLYPVATWTRP